MLMRNRVPAQWLRAAVAVLGLSTLAACGGGGGDPSIERIEVTPVEASAPLGTTQQFEATAILSDDSTRDVTAEVTWASSDTTVATIGNGVDDKGLADTLSLGTTTVSAQLDDVSGSTSFTVNAAAPVSVTLTPGAPSIAKGTTVDLVATATFTDGSARAVTADASWSSNAASVASVSDATGTKGRTRGTGVGTATIRAAYQGVAGTTTVTVTDAVIDHLTVTPPTASIPKGTSVQLTATAVFSDSSTQNVSADASWTTSNAETASVDATGKVQGLAEASATITASYSGQSASAVVSVTPAVLTAITVTPANSAVAKGLTQNFTAEGTYSDGSVANLTSTVAWSSSDEALVTISNASGEAGKASTRQVGSVTIRAASGGYTGETPFTVTEAVLTGLEVTPASVSIPNGTSRQFSVTGFYTDNSRQDLTQSATWSSSDASVADVSNSTGSRGLALAKAVGRSAITASFGGQSASGTLTVTAATLTAIQVTPTNTRLAAGYTRQYAATGVYSDNSTLDLTQTVSWSTAATATATVSNATGSKGLVSAVAPGTTNVVAQSDGVTGSTPVIVTNATLSSIAVTPSSASIAKGTKQTFKATGTFSDNTTQDLSTQVSWTSSATSVATVSNTAGSQGEATAVGTGDANITASITKNSVTRSGSGALTVTAATLTGIAVTPSPASVPKGLTVQLTATGTYTDNSTADITDDVTWTSSDTSKATVTNGGSFGTGTYGVASGVATGTARITAALGSVSGATDLTVTDATLSSIAVTPAGRSVAQGVQVQYTATGTYSDNSTKNITADVTWTSSNTGVATVSNASGSKGLASTDATGSTNIGATLGSTVSPTVTLTVTTKTLSSVAVTPSTATIANGNNQQFTATGTYSNGSTENLTALVTWSSSDTAVATISNAGGTQGLASSVAMGTATITAVSGSGTAARSGTATLTVTSAALTSIALTPAGSAGARLPIGYFQQFTAEGRYADGSTRDITTEVTWSTFNDAIASVSNAAGTKGQVSGVAAGNTSVTATLAGVSANSSIIVTNATLSSIAVTPANATIPAGGTLQYKATGTFSDSSTLDLTRQVTWASSNTGAAAIDQNGLATAGGTLFATTTISATRGSGATAVSGNTTLTRGF